MHLRKYRQLFLFLLLCSFVFAACASTSTNPGQTPTASSKGSSTPTTAPVPPTQTSCPAAGTARAAVTAPLVLGSHQNIVYTVNEFPTNNSTIGTLKRYDLTTGNKTEIVKLTNFSISQAQLSMDGQWILFVTSPTNGQTKLQMVRMDGQGLQTLYCNQSIRNIQWSTNQKQVAFTTNGDLYLLNDTDGTLQLELKPGNSGPPLNINNSAQPFSWLDNTRLYVSFSSEPIGPTDTLGLLDTSRGPNQQLTDLVQVYQWKLTNPTFNYDCWDADSSYDGSTLFISQCAGISAPNCSGSCALGTREGPSDITTKAATGSLTAPRNTIFNSPTLGIGTIRVVSRQTLLLDVENFSVNHTVDRSQNGLWKINTDGSGLTRLTTEGSQELTTLNQYSQTPWANVSRNGDMYAMALASYSGTSGSPHSTTQTLQFGSLNGGAPTTFASISDGTQLSIVGWTTMG